MTCKLIRTLGYILLIGVIVAGCNSVTDNNVSTLENNIESQNFNGIPGLSTANILDSFTQNELDNNWEGDRTFPTGGVTSVSAFGRDNVAQISIDSEETAGGGFNRTEGIKTIYPDRNDFGQGIQVDLYIDPAWENMAARAGVWVAGDVDGSRSNFGIIEFANGEGEGVGTTSHPDNLPDHEGFRIWESHVGFTNVEVDWNYGEWVTLTIFLDTEEDLFTYAVDGQAISETVSSSGSTHIREVFLNSYNYGLDEFPNLNSTSYDAHWEVGSIQAQTIEDCQDDGWEQFGFKNQGQCIRYVNTGKDSR